MSSRVATADMFRGRDVVRFMEKYEKGEKSLTWSTRFANWYNDRLKMLYSDISRYIHVIFPH